MFHIGKAEKIILSKSKGVISSDNTVQAMVRMWDDNLLLLEVDGKIGKELKEGDYIIADYRPITDNSPNRKMKIVKIVRGDLGRSIWKQFEKEHEKRKLKAESSPPQSPMPYIR